MNSCFLKKKFKPLLKWPGGKTRDLNYLINHCPNVFVKSIANYYEPFLGGGAAWLMFKSDTMFVNDICPDLMHFYALVSIKDQAFFDYTEAATQNWHLLTEIMNESPDNVHTFSADALATWIKGYESRIMPALFTQKDEEHYREQIYVAVKLIPNKIKRMREKSERTKKKLTPEYFRQAIEASLKSAFYTHVRYLYNTTEQGPLRTFCFYFLREYAFSSMFRFSASGDFNVPYGGMSYNRKSPNSRLEYWKSAALQEYLDRTNFYCGDYLKFLRANPPKKGDFVFVDPPYDSDFSSYDGRDFNEKKQKELARYLTKECKASFLGIMKNTELIDKLYKHPNIAKMYFDKTYSVSFMDRNDQKAEHVVITRN